MAAVMRLMRIGAKKAPIYRVVVVDGREKRDGRPIESLGTYNPLTEPIALDLDLDRVRYWLGTGAATTDTVRTLLRRVGIIVSASRKPAATAEAAPEA